MSSGRRGAHLLIALVVALAAAAVLVRQTLSAPDPGAGPTVFSVERGASLSTIARELERAGLIRSAPAFRALARLRGLDARLRAGEYELSASRPAGEVLDILARGQVRLHEVVIPEGVTAAGVARRLEDAGLADASRFLEIALDPASASRLGVEGPTLEGYLFPDTYRVARGLPAREVTGILVDAFLRTWSELEDEAQRQGLSMREVATLASIIEKETAVPEERPLIAAVYRNRLEQGMLLQSDPTVIYGITRFDGNLKRAHLEDDSNPYNTYRMPGLPPGPIANPGKGALRAALDPADTDYLFFVSRNDGTHIFSRTYPEHRRAVNRFQRNR